jgi:RimJ/RimL family protein N-acetyltransferase
MELTEGNINGMLSNSYYAVVDMNRRLIGFFCLGKPAQVPNVLFPVIYSENMIDIGLGLQPEWTGRGMGYLFFSFILHHVQLGFPNMPLRLTVASFNKRAIRLYKKAGFIETVCFDKGQSTFLVMVKK